MRTTIEVVAHRGASAHAPEHTFAAYDLALEMGADTLELDVRLTADGRPVVLHDATLARTAGDPRAITDVPLAALTGPHHPLTLDAVFERYGRDIRWLVELKQPCAAMEAAVVSSIVHFGLSHDVTVQSFDHVALRRLRRRAPRLPVAPLLCESLDSRAVVTAIGRAARFAGEVAACHRSIDAAVVAAARVRGLRLRAYTVNETADIERLFGLGVDGVITDHPDRACLARRRQPALPVAA